MKLYNNFTGSAMNKDLDLRVFPKSIYIDANNVRITSPTENFSRSVNLTLGNSVMTSLSLGANAECIGSCIDSYRDKIYWAVVSDSGSYICEYDVVTDTEAIVLSDIRSGALNILGFSSGGYVEMRVINDNDNGRNFLVLTDGENEPKFFDIAIAKTLGVGFTFEDVSLIKAPPYTSPQLTLAATPTDKENNLEAKFLYFAYRYKYQNGEFSALSQFSEFAFFPSNFRYDYSSGVNKAMFNSFSKADIEINTGSPNVSEIQLIVKESGSNTAYIVDKYVKSKQSPVWGDNTTETLTFDNSRIYRALESNQLTRVYDNVPTSAATLEVIGNRIIFGNYTEGYDLEYNGSDINLIFDLDYTSTSGTSGVAHKQVKSNRDYEVAIAYGDGKGRFTTPLVSTNNTTYIPYSLSDRKTQLRLTIDRNSRPPDWAREYRLFIKQSKTDYDTIAPITFYRDGIYAWVKLEGNDIQKVQSGDFLYVKSDTTGLQSETKRAKVVDIQVKERNFLETDELVINGAETLQLAGNYMKITVEDFALSPTAVDNYNFDGYAFRSRNVTNNITGGSNYVETPYFNGNGLDDMVIAGNPTGFLDFRIEVEIVGTGSPNTFRWRKWDVSANPEVGYGAYSSAISITGGIDATINGISIQFGSTTGHTAGDKWYISAKVSAREITWNGGGTAGSNGRRAIMAYRSKDVFSEEVIKAGSTINITYDDSSSDSGVNNTQGYISLRLTSSRDYPNIEEWFYGDNIIATPALSNIVGDTFDVMFRRGSLSGGETLREKVTTTDDLSVPMIMMILSPCGYTGGERVRVDLGLFITEFDNNIIFETIPVDTTTDLFYELPYTYDIINNVHHGDTNQLFGVVDAVIDIPYFNSFGWYNGFESIKIADTFNEKAMILDAKPLIPVDNYKKIKRISSLTYSDVYESTTQFNALNEFNLAEINYKDMDIKYGAIAKLHSRDTDLVVFQHDKTHRVLFSKSVLFNGDGSGNVSQSLNVLGQEVAYTGEYGICTDPESFAFFGNRIYHLDRDRGALMRLSVDGYTEISKEGLSDYFRTLSPQDKFVGGYDLYNDEYLINVAPDGTPKTLAFQEGVGFPSFYEYQPERLVGINNRMYSIKEGQIWLHDNNQLHNNFYGDQRTASITTVFNDTPNDIKHFKSINTESTSAWDAFIVSQSATSTIAAEEFSLEEFDYYAYIRQGETLNTSGISNYQGLGEITNISSLIVSFGYQLPRNLAIGDVIYKSVVGEPVTRGTITTIDVNAGTITLDSVANLVVGDFVMYGKQARVEGEPCKGYTMQLTLTNDSNTANQLFAVKTEAVRSFD